MRRDHRIQAHAVNARLWPESPDHSLLTLYLGTGFIVPLLNCPILEALENEKD